MSVPLPELCQGVLDDSMLDSLVRDLTEVAEITSLSVKGEAQSRAATTPLTLPDAVARLRRGELRGVQVHYAWSDQSWLDTLMREGRQIRLVRRSC